MSRRRSVTQKQIQAPHWDAHEVVYIRSLREGDNQAIQDELAAMSSDGKADMKLALGTSRRLTMLYGIVSWTFTNENGSPLAFSEQALRELAPEDADYIYSQINELNQPMLEAEKKDSSKTALSGSQENLELSLHK